MIEQISEILKNIILSGGVMRIIYCFIQIMIDEENANKMKKNIKNIILFIIFTVTIGEMIDIVFKYYG